MLNALLVVATLASQAPAVPDAPEDLGVLKWEIFVGLTAGLRPDAVGGGAAGLIGINRRVFSWLRPEVSVGLGLFDQPLDVLIPIRIGARLEWPSDARLKPYLWVAFAHFHEIGFEDARRHPGEAVLGSADHGVHHRSGVDTGLGVSFDLRFGSRVGARFNLRGSVTSLVAGHGPPRYVDLLGTVGLIF